MSVMEEPEQPTPQEQHRAVPMSSTAQSVSAASTDDGDSPARDDAAIIKAGLAAVEEWEAEHGPISAEALAWAEEALNEALGSAKEPSDK
ncbi:hypothetical protein [Candidatus Poriferisocius sp.]|uniref:hypothetical protein n=1 Tax=Candidatus Poriferisocius sp. TaxID=3101276 RepID=UPI003B024EBA